MLLRCFPSSLSSIWLTILEEMLKMWKVNDRWTDYRWMMDNRPWQPSWNSSNDISQTVKWIELKPEWKHRDWELLKSFHSNIQYSCYGGPLEILERQPFRILEQNDFSISESPCSPNASHQVSAWSDLRFWRRCRNCENLTTDSWRWMDRGWWTTGHDISYPGAKIQVSLDS